jgi:hypothetical protein
MKLLEKIPDEIILCILRYIPHKELIHQIQAVCKHFYKLASHNILWQPLYKQLFPNSTVQQHRQSSISSFFDSHDQENTLKYSFLYKTALEKSWRSNASITQDANPQQLAISQFQCKIDTTQSSTKGIHCMKYFRNQPYGNLLQVFVGCGPNIVLYNVQYNVKQEEEQQEQIQTCRENKMLEFKGHNLMVWCFDRHLRRMKDNLVSSGIDDRYGYFYHLTCWLASLFGMPIQHKWFTRLSKHI